MTTPDSNIQQYIVRLVMKVDGKPDEPVSGVLGFVELLTANGMRDWVFRVENADTGEILGYYDGWGDEVDMTAIPATPAPDVTPADPVQEPESDESLVALAESLNAESATG